VDAPTPVPTTIPTRTPTVKTPSVTTTTPTTQTRTSTTTTKPTATPAPTNTSPSTDIPPSTDTPLSPDTPQSDTPTETNDSLAARSATITRVIDGDTFEVRFANGEMDTIQLIGVDAPEAITANEIPSEYGIPNSSRGHDWLLQWNENARMFIENNITDRKVLVVTDSVSKTRDDAGHLLAYVYYGPDRNTSLGQTLLERGLVRRKTETNYTLKEQYRRLERNARTVNRGLWGFEPKTTISIRDENETHEQTEMTSRSLENTSPSIPSSSSEHATIPTSTLGNTTNKLLTSEHTMNKSSTPEYTINQSSTLVHTINHSSIRGNTANQSSASEYTTTPTPTTNGTSR
jgi:micrococcal nuclease